MNSFQLTDIATSPRPEERPPIGALKEGALSSLEGNIVSHKLSFILVSHSFTFSISQSLTNMLSIYLKCVLRCLQKNGV